MSNRTDEPMRPIGFFVFITLFIFVMGYWFGVLLGYSTGESGGAPPARLACTHPVVNSKDNFYLSSPRRLGSECLYERGKGWRNPCGISGKLWEPKGE